MRASIIAVMTLALGFLGCVNEASFRSEMLPRAAFELGCPADQVVVTSLGEDSFGVAGCGRRAVYMYVARVGFVNNTGVQHDATRAPSPAPAPQAAGSPTLVYPAQRPPAEEFVVVPLRVYRLRAHADPGAAFTTDVPTIMKNLNRMFVLAGVYFHLEGPPQTVELEGDVPRQRASLKSVLPSAPEEQGFRLFIVHDLDANGAALGGGDLVVQERPALRLVPGPVAEPVARVAAHLLGGALGLGPSRYPSMLMAQGTTGVLLDAPSVSVLHAAAKQVRGAKTFDEAARTSALADAVAEIRSSTTHSTGAQGGANAADL
jgi:hypothetical protein